ncbi:cucumisin-like [Cryptomeria japonica]|uniref:cucumisin-like n=1 Tax=Cryptomeria japonica TaxID=3369 RepID=UPI0027D9ED25|nr:cucumisin-like [Cryptomeria japonica]
MAILNHSRMSDISKTQFLALIILFLLHLNSNASAGVFEESDKKLHIIYMGEIPSDVEGDFHTVAASSHIDMLQYVVGSYEAAQERWTHSYGKSFNGFAAWLNPSEVQEISGIEGVLSVFENKQNTLHTTRSWDFLGFPQNIQRNLSYESDVIVGLLDTGIWPESESFSDTGFGPVPSKWNGKCQTTSDFKACNKKIIGASFYNKGLAGDPAKDFLSPRDGHGHGSHTSSIAAGNVVKNASLLGVGQGDARGGVPGARIAMYKVCWAPEGKCEDVDILAAFDDAINDGVDIISVSLGRDNQIIEYFEDAIAIGSFHAMKKGILVSASAGNSGPHLQNVCNYNPWTLTVAASTTDRQFISPLVLGNNMTLQGTAINTFSMEEQWYPLIYAGNAPNISGGHSSDDASHCYEDSLDPEKVIGKIVLCDAFHTDSTVLSAGGAGVILTSEFIVESIEQAKKYVLPTTIFPTVEANTIKSYINSTSSPLAKILRTVTPNGAVAPIVSYFSSRGPSPVIKSLLKPDIIAPGVNILAAWSKVVPLIRDSEDTRFVDFNIISGTSMACPHATATATYVKSFHPDWSPAAIKSALMTTAHPLNDKLNGNGDAEFGYGSGLIDPVRAMDPGLVYDAGVNDYINMMCSQGYNTTALRLVTGDNSVCSSNVTNNKLKGVRQLNYPSMMVLPKANTSYSVKFPRTVTNVGAADCTYQSVIIEPSGVDVEVTPDTLSFTSLNQKLSFTVKVSGEGLPVETMLAGALTWNCGKYSFQVNAPASMVSTGRPSPLTSTVKDNFWLRDVKDRVSGVTSTSTPEGSITTYWYVQSAAPTLVTVMGNLTEYDVFALGRTIMEG